MSKQLDNGIGGGKRLHWVDIIKGVLVLLMVCGHIPNLSRNVCDTYYLSYYNIFAAFYICFFMQAFFVLSGFTTNFDKEPKEFLSRQVKTLVVPYISFTLISKMIDYFAFDRKELFVTISGEQYFFLIESYWFISALLLSKLAYYFLTRYMKNAWLRYAILIAMMIVGCCLIICYTDLENAYHHHNYFHFKDFLCMALFIGVGAYIKTHPIDMKTYRLAFISYAIISFALFALTHLTHRNFSSLMVCISHGTNLQHYYQIPFYVLFVILGTFSCFYLAKRIKECRFIEYVGRNSIIIYCTHFIVLDVWLRLLTSFILPNTLIKAILFFVSVFGLTLLSCIVLIEVFNKKPFSYMLGKF